jgi:hypothetical protein
MEGLAGLSVTTTKKMPIQTPAGMFGISIALANVDLGVNVTDTMGRAVRGVVVTALNTSSGIPSTQTTDNNGYAAIKADNITDISLVNNKSFKTAGYDRSVNGGVLNVVFDPPPFV